MVVKCEPRYRTCHKDRYAQYRPERTRRQITATRRNKILCLNTRSLVLKVAWFCAMYHNDKEKIKMTAISSCGLSLDCTHEAICCSDVLQWHLLPSQIFLWTVLRIRYRHNVNLIIKRWLHHPYVYPNHMYASELLMYASGPRVSFTTYTHQVMLEMGISSLKYQECRKNERFLLLGHVQSYDWRWRWTVNWNCGGQNKPS